MQYTKTGNKAYLIIRKEYQADIGEAVITDSL